MNIKISNLIHNFDQKEIAKFEAIAASWWNLNGKFRLLHLINPMRLDYIIEHADGLFGKKVLDVGCGGGILTESMAREGAIVTGLDMSFKLLQVARSHAIKTGIKVNYLYETVEEHAIDHVHQYDVITCMEMLEHVPDPQTIVKACAKLVKLGGHVYFSTINRNRKAWLMAIVCAEHILHMIPKGMHDIKKFIKPAELLNWIDKTILKERHIIGLHYNPLTEKFRLAPGVDVNYILHTTYENS